MQKKQSDEKRIMRYVNGLLYFYGVMDFENLYRAVAENLPGNLERDTFKAILDGEGIEEGSSPELCYNKGLYYHFGVEDVNRVLKEQRARKEIPYRPVTEREARFIAKRQYSSLWNLPGKRLFRLLQKKYGYSGEEAREMILYWEGMHKNDVPTTEALSNFLENIHPNSMDEAQSLINSLMELSNHTPLWILKGWTPHEVFERFEKPLTKPLPAKPFEWDEGGAVGKAKDGVKDEAKNGAKSGAGKKGGRKVGRNDPCPCGSGKKYKNCCSAGIPAGGGKDAGLSPLKFPAEQEGRKGIQKTVFAGLEGPLPGSIRPPVKPPTSAEWHALYEAANAYKNAKCWEWMGNDDLFGVMDPETGEIAYCCIMGCMGEFFGLGAHLGSEGLEVVLEMLADPDEEGSIDFFFDQQCLLVSFEDRGDLEKEDRAIIKDLGLKFRGRKQWPLFRSYEPGFSPWFINAWECRLLTLVLQQVLAVALRCRAEKDLLEHEELRTFLVRVPREQDGALEWTDQYLKAALPEKKYITIDIVDELQLRKISNLMRRGRGTWEIDTFWIPFPVQEEKNARPYYPKIFVALDSDTGLILRYEAMENLLEDGELCIEALIQLLEENMVPSRILVERDETYYLLVEICRRLDIPLKKVPYLNVMPEIREKMYSGEL
ncbi:MAG: hypothetical protein GX989_00295 [Firmicutes bacterium]|nr:hypothetical protein [Bacillota bacterium]